MKSLIVCLILAGSLAAVASSVSACSVCRCGESMMLCTADSSDLSAHLLNGLPEMGKFRLQFQTAVSSKTNKLEDEAAAEMAVAAKPNAAHAAQVPVGSEHQREYRPSVRASYGLTKALAISAELPFSYKRLTEVETDATKLTTSSGIGDAEATLAWSNPIARTARSTWTLGLSALAKLPTGSNNLQNDGGRADEHLQPGTGSYDFQFGAALSRLAPGMTIHGSLYYRLNGKNDYNYSYGDAVLYNLGVQKRISGYLYGLLQLNGRHAARDIEDNLDADNTGGTVVYVAPGLRFGLTPHLSLSTNLQIPVYQDLYGVQSEKVVLNSGLSFEL